jgi:hypothetical protein
VPRDQVSISYSREDDTWRVDLETHLKPYIRNGSITPWSDQQIRPGSKWEPVINATLTNTRVAVLLVSPDFFNSDFIHENELGPLLKRAEEGGAKILWIPIRHSAYKQTPLKNYQALGNPDKPLAAIPRAKRDKVWVDICEKIQKEVSAISATPDLPAQPPKLEHQQESEAIPSFHPSEPGVTPTLIEETAPLAPAPLSSGQKSLVSAAARVAAERQRQDAALDALRQQRLSRAATRDASWGTIRGIFHRLWDQIRAVAPDVERLQGDAEPSLLLQWGPADLLFTPINVDTYTFNRSEWDVLNGYYISLSQMGPRYNWSGNLLLVRRPQDESFRWYEVGFFETPLLQRTRSAPFGAKNPDDYQNADLAASPVLASWQLAFEPIPIESDHEQSFHDRWMERFAQAAVGKLREPQLPLAPPAPTGPSAAPGVLNLVAATSVLVALSEEREALLELATADRRTAMKNCWEGLAKDILLAGKCEKGQLHPDSRAIDHALQRLESSTTYPLELVVRLKDLQATARKVFNQSQWAYDPSESEAREFILRCETAREQLRRS